MSGILAFTLKHKDQLFTTLLFYIFFFISGDWGKCFLLVDSHKCREIISIIFTTSHFKDLTNMQISFIFQFSVLFVKIPSRHKYNQLAVVQNSLFKRNSSRKKSNPNKPNIVA